MEGEREGRVAEVWRSQHMSCRCEHGRKTIRDAEERVSVTLGKEGTVKRVCYGVAEIQTLRLKS